MKKIKKILILNGQYLPGYKGGGPIQSCYNLIENLTNKFEFYVLCADRDFKSNKPYENIEVNSWNKVGSAKVFYMSPDMQNLKGFNQILNSLDFDTIYLNGFFSPIFTIKPLILKWLGKLKGKKVILTPRGDFTGGCENKKLKKYSYIYLCKLVGLYNGLIWHATSEIEEKDIKNKFRNANIFTVSNLAAKYVPKDSIINKKQGELKLVFISRIFPKKNLKFALEILKEVKEGNIIFDIYGPMEDNQYWNECMELIKQIPSNVKVQYKGEVAHSEIENVFRQYHAFLFPTLGENYGHVIVEAMMNNCLCILSKDVTPWNNYIEIVKLGGELCNKDRFVKDIYKLINMSENDFYELLSINNEYVERHISLNEDINKYIEILK
ncbi:glycosyl transferases group 1 family protein [[Clostridium] bifermentans ATCC 19299]|uniref:glycosyltransferase family 4 protein n=1 Tax=Paraclostridium bifermentans TaxID=1490 RepID=UPI00038DAF8F|nr:glycosyltransferase family 4 protein [Paraclostridium bifermentans]EQK45999.1 glycosyl transferases group 1 family protein [[Clostridium] bifermentans ATCC 19299] [Paraclostridium bifermentans ATCC 19299]